MEQNAGTREGELDCRLLTLAEQRVDVERHELSVSAPNATSVDVASVRRSSRRTAAAGLPWP